MTIFLFASITQGIIKFLLGAVAIFLILLVLVQRGRGGGLAGALGGMGGSSAFGAKAGDIFTKITVGAAAFWIILCIVAAKMDPSGGSLIDTGGGRANASSSADSTSVDGPALISGDQTDPAEAEEGSDDSSDDSSTEAATEEAPQE